MLIHVMCGKIVFMQKPILILEKINLHSNRSHVLAVLRNKSQKGDYKELDISYNGVSLKNIRG